MVDIRGSFDLTAKWDDAYLGAVDYEMTNDYWKL